MDVMKRQLLLKPLLQRSGIGSDFNQKLESSASRYASSENLKLIGDYNIDGTPTVVINGYLMVVPIITILIRLSGRFCNKVQKLERGYG
jgi:protein-disulfide isomerase